MFKTGDLLIYRKPKRSYRPGPRAKNIRPVNNGDEYHYEVDKFWRVVESKSDELVIKTRSGKVHHLAPNDPHIKKPNVLVSLLMRHRFPATELA